MSKKYFISDHHFGQENIAKFSPFANTQERGEWLVAQHNSRVTKRDTVIIGGDFAVGKTAYPAILEYLPQLNGNLHLLLGNHDDLSMDVYLRMFKSVKMYTSVRVGEIKYWVTHFPIHEQELQYHIQGNIHGHSHWNVIPDPRYINMCVEHCNGIPQTADEWLEIHK